MNWFKKLMGFNEESPQRVKEYISIKGEYLYSKANGASAICDHFSTQMLKL